ncbi:hypothetical protein RFI_35968 [Reticulomyxa filosa]|uniref:Uncharacterized protein n=1 Tax=Reticulomyxa filosa TaxID=46433 RepID=X6LJE7_RETFI|nr:hypothetical protein RFI_35968 [Reticulomyxa filosa]|eukprot:ETO01471.1 hypothetical protein RFI_35968 [Reticulomyxa filosa]
MHNSNKENKMKEFDVLFYTLLFTLVFLNNRKGETLFFLIDYDKLIVQKDMEKAEIGGINLQEYCSNDINVAKILFTMSNIHILLFKLSKVIINLKTNTCKVYKSCVKLYFSFQHKSSFFCFQKEICKINYNNVFQKLIFSLYFCLNNNLIVLLIPPL